MHVFGNESPFVQLSVSEDMDTFKYRNKVEI